MAGSAAVGLIVSFAAVAAAGPWESGQRTSERAVADAGGRYTDTGGGTRGSGPRTDPRAATPPPASDVLPALGGRARGSGTAAPPSRDGLAARLGPLLDDPALGTLPTAAVVDAATGRLLYGHRASTPSVPASTVKIATATAALSLLGPDHRITTVAASPGGDRVILVGGGDPTLDLHALARDTAAALAAGGTRRIRLTYDVSLYSGPLLHPLGRNENLAPVSALMTDEGRLDGSTEGPAARAGDPAAEAAATFAALLRGHGVTVTGEPAPGRVGPDAVELAASSSPPLSALVERMLTNSDNDLAEALARQVAIATGRPADFSGAQQSVTAQLRGLGVPLDGVRFADGSGLNRVDAVSAEQLARLLALAGSPAHPELRAVLTGLPVAGFTGTLTDRFHQAGDAVGLVRAKTGTLTGVNSMAGTVVDADGRLLSFAFMAHDTASAPAAQTALDRLAAALAGCGCG